VKTQHKTAKTRTTPQSKTDPRLAFIHNVIDDCEGVNETDDMMRILLRDVKWHELTTETQQRVITEVFREQFPGMTGSLEEDEARRDLLFKTAESFHAHCCKCCRARRAA
jgi:hypothetical protein